MPKPILFDLEPLSKSCTDLALDTIYKALSDPPDGDMLWRPHHDPYMRDLVENVTQLGQSFLLNVQSDLMTRIGGDVPGKLRPNKGILAKAGEWMRWDKSRIERVQRQLDEKAAADYTLDDWMLLVDYLVMRYLPDNVIHDDSEYIAVRSVLAGKVKANMESRKGITDKTIMNVIAMLPHGTDMIPFTLNELERQVISFAAARAAEFITDIGDNVRHRIKQIIIQHETMAAAHAPEATLWNLQSKLLDEFGVLNRDWRRVALTETVRDANEGFLAGLPAGTKVRRVEAYQGACPFCRKINGMEFTVVPADKDEKDGATEVWVGKTNMDRSASPRKRSGDELIERTPAEMWWPAAGVQHPNCRGGWVIATGTPPDVDPGFVDWLDNLIDESEQL